MWNFFVFLLQNMLVSDGLTDKYDVNPNDLSVKRLPSGAP